MSKVASRRSVLVPPPTPLTIGYRKLYVDHLLQADEGTDLEFPGRPPNCVRPPGQALTAEGLAPPVRPHC